MLQAREEWETGGFFFFFYFFFFFFFLLAGQRQKEKKGNNNVLKLLHRLKSEMTIGGRNRDAVTQQNTHTHTQ